MIRRLVCVIRGHRPTYTIGTGSHCLRCGARVPTALLMLNGWMTASDIEGLFLMSKLDLFLRCRAENRGPTLLELGMTDPADSFPIVTLTSGFGKKKRRRKR